MALTPFFRPRFFDDFFDPFWVDRFDFFYPWYDFEIVPSLPPAPPAVRWVKEQERVTYKSTSVSNNTSSFEIVPRPPQPDKYSVQFSVAGFDPISVKTSVDGQKVVVEAKKEDRRSTNDYQIREFRKAFELPDYVDASRVVSTVSPDNTVVVEAPLKTPVTERRFEQHKTISQSFTQVGEHRGSSFGNSAFLDDSDIQTRIVDKGIFGKQLEITVQTKNYRPDEIKVSARHNHLIIRGEHRYSSGTRNERSSFYKVTSLPVGTQIDLIQSRFSDDGTLKIEAPIFG